VFVSKGCGESASGGPIEEAELHKIGLVDIGDGVRFFADRGGDGVQSDRTAIVLFNNGVQHLVVDFIQPDGIDLELGKRGGGYILGYGTVSDYLSVVTDTFEEAVGDAGGAAGAAGDFPQSLFVGGHLKNLCGALEDCLQRSMVIEIEAVNGTETVAQRSAEEGVAGGSADKGKAGQVQTQAFSPGALADNDIEGEVFQGGI